MSEWFPLDLEITKPHPGHEAHLCMAKNVGFVKNNLQEYKKYVRNVKFVCRNCGRAAAKAENLGAPVPQWADEKAFLNDPKANPAVAWPAGCGRLPADCG